MNELDEPHRSLRTRALALARSIEPIAARADEGANFDPEVRRALAASGLCGVVVPAAYGGSAEAVDALSVTVVREGLMSVSTHLDTMFAMQGIGSFAVGIGASEALRRNWLPRVGTLDAIAGLALTEPEAGSDLKSIVTTVRADGDELVVSGRKSFISNGTEADFFTVLGRESDGYSLVLVPSDAAGVRCTATPPIIAPHVLGEIEFDEVRVPADHRVGDAGRGFGLVLATLATFRVSVAGAAVGLADAALTEAVRYTSGREQFGRPLAELGAVAQLLGRAHVDVEMARSLTYRAARAAASDPRAALGLSSIAKVGATEAASRVTDACVQVMGRAGLLAGSLVERMYRAARPMRIYEGATEVLLEQIAGQLVRTRGAEPE